AERRALHDAGAVRPSASDWGTQAFDVGQEPALRDKYKDRLAQMKQALPLYLDGVRDLKAVAQTRGVPILYALQPELLGELASDLSAQELEIQKTAFQHHRDLGTLAWRVLGLEIAAQLAPLSSDGFQFMDLRRIAHRDTATLYTDYCHLTPRGNEVVA